MATEEKNVSNQGDYEKKKCLESTQTKTETETPIQAKTQTYNDWTYIFDDILLCF